MKLKNIFTTLVAGIAVAAMLRTTLPAFAVDILNAPVINAQISNGGTFYNPTFSPPVAGGIVNSVAVATASGIQGTSSGGANPSLTIGTTVNGIVKGNGSVFSVAASGIDYVIPSGSVALASNIAGGAASQVVIQTASGVSNFLGYSATGTALNLVELDSAGNAHINNLVVNSTSTVTSATTITLTNASSALQILTGTHTQLIVLPDATTMSVTTTFYIDNASTAATTVQSNGGAQLAIIGAGNYAEFQLTSNGTAAGVWNTVFSLPTVATGILADAGGVLGFTQTPTLAGINGVTVDSSTNAPVTRASTDTLTNKTLTAPAAVWAEAAYPSTQTLPASAVASTMLNNQGQTTAEVLTLPLAASSVGANFIWSVASSVSATTKIAPNVADRIYFDANAVASAGSGVISANPQTVGDAIGFSVIRTGTAAWGWLVKTIRGTAWTLN